MAKPILVLGTRNKKKLGELQLLLGPLGLELLTLDAFPASLEVEETGNSFAENAALKASQQAKAIGAWVLGEDSGLAVDALRGAPGIYSARFSGPDATDEKNNNLLLEELKSVPLEKRTAHYVCSAAISDPQGNIRCVSEGTCQGRIRFERYGAGGFGYDPLFEIMEYHRTFGELSPAVKAAISHRSRAMRGLVPKLKSLMSQGQWLA
ncbi:MAG: RdgB/HAM1 family non-canonical purine NTP pyrophosphatase [Planctomycetaceae bacterium]